VSTDPRRLLEDLSAPQTLRNDLVRAADHGIPFDVAAGLGRLRDAIGTGPTSGGSGGGAGGGAAGQGASTAAKAMLAVSLAAGVVVGVIWLVTGGDAEDSAPVDPPAHAGPSSPLPPEAHEERTRPGHDQSRQRFVEPQPESPDPSPSISSVPAAPSPRSAARGSPSGANDVQREIAQLAELRRLVSRDPARALVLANAGQREFPQGLFMQEREAHAVLALEALGRHAEATRRGRRFLARWPEGPQAVRVQRVVEAEMP